jgi:hypothetical protein
MINFSFVVVVVVLICSPIHSRDEKDDGVACKLLNRLDSSYIDGGGGLLSILSAVINGKSRVLIASHEFSLFPFFVYLSWKV